MDENFNAVNAAQEPAVEVPAAEPNTQAEPVQAQSAEPAEPQQEKPKQSAEDNAKYAAARRQAEREAAQKVAEAEAKAADKMAARIAKDNGWTTRDGREITTVEEYEIALRDSQLTARGIDPAVVEEAVRNDPLRKKYEAELAQIEKQKQTQAEFTDFAAYFREEYGRNFDPAKDKIPQEVWEAQAKGAKLRDAYTTVRMKELKAEADELRKQLKAQEVNTKNAESAVGSVNGDGATNTGDFITFDTFEANKGNQSWVIKNLDKITKSRLKW